jgi:c-di-GMP-binding flagellar brake protein YcgR
MHGLISIQVWREKHTRGGFMLFEKQDDIAMQLREISELAMSVSVVINNKITLHDCRLICKADKEMELSVQIASGNCPETGDVDLTCILPKASYTFRSRIIPETRTDSQGYRSFKIQFPDRITEEEKRQYFRVRPSETNPIQIRLAAPDSDTIDVEAMDIGGGGISFAVLKNENCFNIGDPLYLDINLPTFHWLSALAVIKNITALQNTVRIGVEFSRVSEDAYAIIMQYITATMTEKRDENR